MSILYKYRDWLNENHRKMIFNGEIYIPSPLSLNDPFDCQITESIELLDTDEKINRFVELQAQECEPNTLNIEHLKTNLRSRIINDPKSVQKEIDDFSLDKLEGFTGVFSLSTEWKSITQWSLYANSHKGFCVGFDKELLDYSGIFNRGGCINYSKSYPLIDPNMDDFIESSFIQSHTKSILWQNEYEYRYIKIFQPEPSADERKVNINHRFIKEIILGLNFPQNEIESIKNITDKYKIRLYKVTKIPYKFEIDRIEI